MDKMVMDYSFLKSLLVLNDSKHDLTIKMISTFDDQTRGYIPYHTFLQIMRIVITYIKLIFNDGITPTNLYIL